MSKQKVPLNHVNMISERLKLMIYTGTCPTQRTISAEMYTRFLLVLVLGTFVLQCVQLVTAADNDLGDLVMDIVFTLGTWQLFIKLRTLHTRTKLLSSMINRIYTKFWTPEFLPADKQDLVAKIYRYTMLIANIFNYVVRIALVVHYVSCYLKNNLILNVWLPHRALLLSSPYYEGILVAEAAIFGIPVVFAFIQIDMLYMIITGLTLAQFRMLKYKLGTIGASEYPAQEYGIIIDCVKHHNVLFNTLADIETLYSTAALHMLGTDIFLDVICLFGLLVEENVGRRASFLLIYIMITTQLFLYCLFGQFIEDETQSVAEAAYNSKWEDIPNRDVRMGLVMIIGRSQRPVHFTMGGIMNLCLDSFTNISRMMFSLFTLMMNMQEEREAK